MCSLLPWNFSLFLVLPISKPLPRLSGVWVSPITRQLVRNHPVCASKHTALGTQRPRSLLAALQVKVVEEDLWAWEMELDTKELKPDKETSVPE